MTFLSKIQYQDNVQMNILDNATSKQDRKWQELLRHELGTEEVVRR